MKLHHIAFWTTNIDKLQNFYTSHFKGKLLFSHKDGDFRCIFMRICNDINIEIMTRKDLPERVMQELTGYSHISFEVDSKKKVDQLTEYFQKHEVPFQKVKEQYDDGFYESSVLDPDGNIIEIAYIDRNVNPSV